MTMLPIVNPKLPICFPKGMVVLQLAPAVEGRHSPFDGGAAAVAGADDAADDAADATRVLLARSAAVVQAAAPCNPPKWPPPSFPSSQSTKVICRRLGLFNVSTCGSSSACSIVCEWIRPLSSKEKMKRPSNSPVSSLSSKGSSLRSPRVGPAALRMALLPIYFLMVSRGAFMMDADLEREVEMRGATEEPDPRPPTPLSSDAALPLLFPIVLQRTMNCSLPPPDAVVDPAIDHVNIVPCQKHHGQTHRTVL